jgi:predicted ATP-binding protein involved in virulence
MAAPAQRSDVFLAYSRRDQLVAQRFVTALQKHGVSTWWDLSNIPVGADWEQFLFEQVSNTPCLVALWSSASVESQWVLYEARIAARRNVLIPVLIENIAIPGEFGRIQSAYLVDWDGDDKAPGFVHVIDAVRRLVETAPDPAHDTRIYKESQRTAERRARDLFQRNVRSELLIEHVQLKGTAFYEDLSWNINPSVNVLLGRNGYGKTHLLRGLLALLQYDDRATVETIGTGSGSVSILRDDAEATIQFAEEFFDEEHAVGQLPILAIPDTRFVNRSTTTLSSVSDETTGSDDRTDLARFGAWHFLSERPYESLIQTFLYGLCLDYFDNGRTFEKPKFELIRGVVRELTDKSFDFDRVTREGRSNRFTLYVRTEGNEENALPIQKASQGTASVIAMVGLIYDFLDSLKRENAPDVRQRTGIVVIDEIDAHLHPAWQQKIVSLLRDRFPRVQFIITAHNPIVVAGCLEDEVAVLRKNPDRGFSLVQFPNDFVGWQIDEIYRKVFDIESPDANFSLYDAMRPFKGGLQQEAGALAAQTQRSKDEDRTLAALEEQILYIEKVEQTRTRRFTQEELERENKMLQDRVVGLESAHASAADARRELTQLHGAFASTQREASRLARRARVSTATALLLFAGLVACLISAIW